MVLINFKRLQVMIEILLLRFNIFNSLDSNFKIIYIEDLFQRLNFIQ